MSNKALDTVLSEFMKIAEIPRQSHHEERIGQYLFDWARARGLHAERDELGSVIIDKAATKGLEQKPLTIFQAHMDMVCIAAEGVKYDPLNDPIRVINDGVTLRADGTSLGADDGIGVAMCLYLLGDDSLRHGPIRAIITTNEEDGMDSMAMDARYLQGEYLVNLDWETIGSLCNSCAGGDFFNYSHKADFSKVEEGFTGFDLSFNKLLGGHSGVGINKGHANAIVSAATALRLLSGGGVKYRIAEFEGGQAKNAIPNFARVKLAVAGEDGEKALEILEGFRREFEEAFGNIEPTMELAYGKSESKCEKALSEELSNKLTGLLCSVPNNVHTMSPFVDGLVESSSNLGVISLGDERVEFTVFARSSVAYQATQLGLICGALADSFGFEFMSEGHVPGWAVNPKSSLTLIACREYEKLTGEPMIVEPVHAGVECGAFAQKNPGLDMIAIGPTLLDVHSPKECCNIADIKTITELLIAILERIAD